MNKLQTWISALRLRTLPLAVSSIFLGIALAEINYSVNGNVALLTLITAICLQILSNLANDYGDFVKGTDNEKRIGNLRALQSGNIKIGEMKIALALFIGLSLISGIALLYQATNGIMNMSFILFFIVGVLAIIAAIKYTVGKNAYGYSGLGDLAVFVFFGPVAVLGTFILSTNFEFNLTTDFLIFLPAIGIGLLSTAVLNTNNIRDIENDCASGKMTIPVKIGLSKARIYHSILIFVSLICFLFFLFTHLTHWVLLLQIPSLFFIVKTWLSVMRTEPSSAYNSFLKQLSLGTLFFVIVFIVTHWIEKLLMIKDLIQQF